VNTRRALAVVAVAGVSAGSIFAGGRLVPDTASYAVGGSSWSSPLLAGAGLVGGIVAVRAVAAASALALAFVVSRAGWGWPFVLLVLPAGWSMLVAGADAAGAVASTSIVGRRARWIPLVALVHLEAALVLVAVTVAARVGVRWSAGAALAAGAGACVGQWHMQARYFLPGLAILAVYGLRDASVA